MFKLRSKIPNENGVIHTYFEPVIVKNGIAQCRSLAAKRHLEGLGFTEVTEDEEKEQIKRARKRGEKKTRKSRTKKK